MTDTATELKENKILEALEALISECESRISEGYSLRSHGQQYPNITRDFFIRRAKKLTLIYILVNLLNLRNLKKFARTYPGKS